MGSNLYLFDKMDINPQKPVDAPLILYVKAEIRANLGVKWPMKPGE